MKTRKSFDTKRGSTLFLRLVVLGMLFLVAFLCGLLLPAIHQEWRASYPDIAYMRYPVLAGLTTTAVAFFVAMYQALKLLGYVDNDTAFSQNSIQALRAITHSALVISVLYAGSLPVLAHMAEYEDAPGLILLGLMFTGAPLVVAVFAAVVQHLLQNVIAIKSENDLTV